MPVSVAFILLTKDHPFTADDLASGLNELWPDGPLIEQQEG